MYFYFSFSHYFNVDNKLILDKKKKKKGPVNCISRLTSEIERRLLKSEFQVQIAALCEGFHEG